MLGFLGTVMGITEALGDLSKNAELLATSIDKAINGLLGGLYDTTIVAIVRSAGSVKSLNTCRNAFVSVRLTAFIMP